MINTLAIDLIAQTARNIAEAGVTNIQEVRLAKPLAAFSAEVYIEHRELKQFLRANLYQHYKVLRMTNKAHRIIGDLFRAFMDQPQLLPPQYQQKVKHNKPRTVADYIAGMTDRYAMREYQRLFSVGDI